MSLSVFLPAKRIEVSVRGMKVKEINLLTNKQAMLSGQAMQSILKDCLETEGLDVEKMLNTDRNALFFGIRRATFGDEYDVKVKCPSCNSSAIYTVDLSKLPAKEGNPELVDRFEKDPEYLAPFKMGDGRLVHWRMLRGSDSVKMIQIQKNKSDQLVSESLLMKIKKVEGLTDEGRTLKGYVSELDAGHLQEFNEYYDSCEPGFDDELHVTCQNGLCGEEITAKMGIDPENFFKRSAKKKS